MTRRRASSSSGAARTSATSRRCRTTSARPVRSHHPHKLWALTPLDPSLTCTCPCAAPAPDVPVRVPAVQIPDLLHLYLLHRLLVYRCTTYGSGQAAQRLAARGEMSMQLITVAIEVENNARPAVPASPLPPHAKPLGKSCKNCAAAKELRSSAEFNTVARVFCPSFRCTVGEVSRGMCAWRLIHAMPMPERRTVQTAGQVIAYDIRTLTGAAA